MLKHQPVPQLQPEQQKQREQREQLEKPEKLCSPCCQAGGAVPAPAGRLTVEPARPHVADHCSFRG